MPNHITNIIRFHKSLTDKIINKDGFVDFNLCVPMPPHSDTFYAIGDLGDEEKKQYGKNNWYDWSCSNWGTKWNAYEQSVWLTDDICTATFLTAWCYPYLWTEELASHGNFTLLYADEVIGHNCGIVECVDGQHYVENDENTLTPIEAIALSLYVKREDPYDYADWITPEGEEVDADLAEVCANYRDILAKILPDGFKLP